MSTGSENLFAQLSAFPSQCSRTSWFHRLQDRHERTWNVVRKLGIEPRHNLSSSITYVKCDALKWITQLPPNSIQAVVTDPPYGIVEYEEKNHSKLRGGKGGVWRIPPSFDGAKRRPVPRFTVLSKEDLLNLHVFFSSVAHGLLRALVPGGHVFIASNPLVSTMTFHAFLESGFEKRGEIIRLVQTLRGGDRPKGAEEDFPDVSVMPKSCWEPWGIFRKPIEGTVADNLRSWGAGGLRRISDNEPFKDVIQCSPTRSTEREIAPHPSLKPQRFLRKLVRAALPLGIGIIYDPFAGSGSTLAAAAAMSLCALGSESDTEYFAMAKRVFEPLSTLPVLQYE